jgi:hypothetical protein
LLAVWCGAALAWPGARRGQAARLPAPPAGQQTPVLRFQMDDDYYPHMESVDQAAEDFALLHGIGVKILRVGLGWDAVNPLPGVYDWSFWRPFIRRAAAAGIEVRPYFLYPPAWAAPGWNSPPNDAADYGRACAELARQLKPWVRYYEVWNEVDASTFWTGTQAQYLQVLRACSHAIRAVQPAARIVLAGLTSLDADWISALKRMGGRGLYDVVAFHTYAEGPYDSAPLESLTDPGRYPPPGYPAAWEIASDHGRLPVWMNEGGATTAVDFYNNERTQASWVRRMVGTLLSVPGRPLQLFGLYEIRDLDPRLSTPIGDALSVTFYQHTGIFSAAGQPKLAAHTYGDLVRLLDGHRPTLETGVTYSPTSGVPAAFHLHAWRLETGTQVVMLWDTQNTSGGTVRLPLPGASAWLHEPDGTVHRVTAFDGRTLTGITVAEAAIPLLYEIRPATARAR